MFGLLLLDVKRLNFLKKFFKKSVDFFGNFVYNNKCQEAINKKGSDSCQAEFWAASSKKFFKRF